MCDCIKREDAILEIQKFGVGAQDFEDYTPEQAERFVIGRLESIPAADVAPVVKGKWLDPPKNPDFGLGFIECSICGFIEDYHTRFCPNCGAKMKEERK